MQEEVMRGRGLRNGRYCFQGIVNIQEAGFVVDCVIGVRVDSG
jgi:hypothetical protein